MNIPEREPDHYVNAPPITWPALCLAMFVALVVTLFAAALLGVP